jgi:hypothetical protein
MATAASTATDVTTTITTVQSERERLTVRLVIVWLLILPLVAFWLSWLRPQAAADLTVFPVLPKANEPVVATLRVSNLRETLDPARFTLYADGRVVLEGTTSVPAESVKVVQFARALPQPARGSYTASVTTADGAVRESHQLPEYSPQVLSSFVSFAASSTTMMTSLINMSYYRSSFAGTNVLDFGLVLVLVMLGMTVFVEAMSVNPTRAGRTLLGLGMLAHRLRLVLVSLYIVFGGLAVTRLAIVFGVVS